MASLANARTPLALCALATCAFALACKKQAPPDPGPDIQILSDALRLRTTDPLPNTSPFFDGTTLKLVAARGETLGFQVRHRQASDATLLIKANGVSVRGWIPSNVEVKRQSTAGIYGATRGAGSYPDVLKPIDSSDDAIES